LQIHHLCVHAQIKGIFPSCPNGHRAECITISLANVPALSNLSSYVILQNYAQHFSGLSVQYFCKLWMPYAQLFITETLKNIFAGISKFIILLRV